MPKHKARMNIFHTQPTMIKLASVVFSYFLRFETKVEMTKKGSEINVYVVKNVEPTLEYVRSQQWISLVAKNVYLLQ